MLSKYFEMKTSSQDFKNNINNLISNFRGKKVLVYGAGQGFFALDKIYNFKGNFDIVAISDKKFETKKDGKTGLKEIAPDEILNETFDAIIVTNEKGKAIEKFLNVKLDIDIEKINLLFTEELKDESANYNWLCAYKFSKTLPKLVKRLKGKSVILYGAGAYLELIHKYYDLSGLNIIGISDKRFTQENSEETFLGYKIYTPKEIKKVKPDYVLVATRFYIGIIEDLYYRILKDTGIKIRPLVKKSFITLLKEIWK